MVHILKMADRLFDGFDGHSSVSSKCVSEMAMALHYIRRDYPADMVDAAALARIEARIFDWIHQDGWLRMIGNEFVLHQCATPYLFLRGRFHSPVHEGLIADVAAHDRMLWECTPYRRMERDWLLAELGFGPGPDWDGAAVLKDARRAYGFDRMLAYAFTHVVFFVTRFAKGLRPDPQVKGVAMMLLAQAEARNDVDLFWECAICLMSQPLDEAELSGLVHLLAVVRDRNAVLWDSGALLETYHPILVHDMLRGMMLRRFGVDIVTVAPGVGPGPFGEILRLSVALGQKDAGRIVAAYAACRAEPWVQEMVEGRIAALGDLAARRVLFAREFAAVGVLEPDAGVYEAAVAGIAGVLAGLDARRPSRGVVFPVDRMGRAAG